MMIIFPSMGRIPEWKAGQTRAAASCEMGLRYWPKLRVWNAVAVIAVWVAVLEMK